VADRAAAVDLDDAAVVHDEAGVDPDDSALCDADPAVPPGRGSGASGAAPGGPPGDSAQHQEQAFCSDPTREHSHDAEMFAAFRLDQEK
jgi:hypothetical protein